MSPENTRLSGQRPRLILASGSPRRRELLEEAGYRFLVVPPHDGAESGAAPGATPAEMVRVLALNKLRDVVERVAGPGCRQPTIVLAADTVADCDGTVLGKPQDRADAERILRRLSGRTHRVLTGVGLQSIDASGTVRTQIVEVDQTVLIMDELSASWLAGYLDSGLWRGKAGAFGYQDDLGVVRIQEGSASNVVGLPMERVRTRLAELGCFPESDS